MNNLTSIIINVSAVIQGLCWIIMGYAGLETAESLINELGHAITAMIDSIIEMEFV